MKRIQKSERWLFPVAAIGAAAMLFLSAGCQEEEERPLQPRTTQFALTPAASCDDIRDQLSESYTEQALQWLYQEYYYDDFVGMPEAGGDNSADGDSGGRSDAPSEFTDTNVQEAGVDEPDIIKTDGTHIYALADNALHIVESWPPEDTARVGRLDFPSSVNVQSMFMQGDTIAVFGSIWGYYDYWDRGMPGVDEWWGEDAEPDSGVDPNEPYFSGTRITLVDISDRSNPTILRQLDIEGSYISARMIGSSAYLITNSGLRGNVWRFYEEVRDIDGLPQRDSQTSSDELEGLRDDARPLLRAFFDSKLAEEEIVDLLPRRRIVNNENEIVLYNSMYECTDLYLPAVNAELGLLNISSFELDDKSSINSTGLLANGWQVYASQQNLYIAMSSRSWWGWWGWGADQKNESHIHKFQLDGGNVSYRASGEVDGWILNQFSFSEHNGYLRVATTDNRFSHNPVTGEFEDEGGNHIIVLKEEDGLLVETGSVRDLAPTERVYSARFMGNRGYVVTFRETDPFYTLDLADPYDPQMIGELKIEGFSSYMHPIGENHLLAIGRDGDENGFMTGVHLQVFDVSDMADPVRTQHHVISTGGWSSDSEAMWNHHAFTYQARLGVLAVPMNIWDDGDQFTGLMLFDATADGITEIGRIDHGDLASQSWCVQQGEDANCTPANYWQWWSQMRRSIMMSGDDDTEEYIYSISSVGLKVNKTFDVDQELASLLWRQ